MFRPKFEGLGIDDLRRTFKIDWLLIDSGFSLYIHMCVRVCIYKEEKEYSAMQTRVMTRSLVKYFIRAIEQNPDLREPTDSNIKILMSMVALTTYSPGYRNKCIERAYLAVYRTQYREEMNQCREEIMSRAIKLKERGILDELAIDKLIAEFDIISAAARRLYM